MDVREMVFATYDGVVGVSGTVSENEAITVLGNTGMSEDEAALTLLTMIITGDRLLVKSEINFLDFTKDYQVLSYIPEIGSLVFSTVSVPLF